jgi:DMSO reductase anchor subunit
VGAFATIWLLQLLGASTRLGVAAIASMFVAGLALAASTLHLGRPIHAYRALKMWRRSWLSREVLLFSAFSAVATVYAALLALEPAEAGPHVREWAIRSWGSALAGSLGALTVVLGLAGVTASAYIYRVPARPAWNTRLTLARFIVTAGVLGPLFAAAVGAGDPRTVALAAAVMAGLQFVLIAFGFLRSVASDVPELKGTARLLSTVLANRLVLRGILLAAGGVVLPLLGVFPALALLLALGGEILGRYLFFVSVVPKHLAAPYVAPVSEAA